MKQRPIPEAPAAALPGHLSLDGPERKVWDYCMAVYERWKPWPQDLRESDRMLLTLLQWPDRDSPLFRMLRDTVLEVFQRRRAADRAGSPFPDEDSGLVRESAWSVLEFFGAGELGAERWLEFFRLCGRCRRAFPDSLLLECLLNGIHNYYAGFFRGVAEHKRRKREAYLGSHPAEVFMLTGGGGSP